MRTGYWYALRDDLVKAEINLDNAITIYKIIDELEGQAEVHMGKALILTKRNDITSARHTLDECSSIRDKVLAHGEAAQWLIFFADHLLGCNLSEGEKLCLEYAQIYAAKAKDLNLQNQIKERLQKLK